MTPFFSTQFLAGFSRVWHRQQPLPLWARFVLVALIACLAHRFVLQADFFMDDYYFLVDPALENGSKWAEQDSRWLPFLLWTGMAQVAGISSPAFHLLNLAAHVAVCCLMLPVGRAFLDRFGWFYSNLERDQAAMIGAMVFACHPLGTETVHYARCLMESLITLFYILGVWAALKLTTRISGTWVLVLICAFLGARVSKEQGLPQIALGLILIGLASIEWGGLFARGPLVRGLKRWYLGFGAAAAMVILLGLISPWLHVFWRPLFGEHVLTQGRIFWEYAQRMIVPVNLSADHYVPWSVGWGDWPAVAGLGAVMGLGLTILWCLISGRYRGVALLIGLAVMPLGLRFAYSVQELMVEYRTYPALPWLGLLAGCGLVWLRSWNPRVGVAAVTAVVMAFVLLSNQRSQLWSNEGALIADVLEQYPMNIRATTLDQGLAWRYHDWQAVLRLLFAADEQVKDHERFNREHRWRQYGAPRVYEHYAIAHQYATLAITQTQGVKAGLDFADRMIQDLDRRYPGHYIDPKTREYVAGNPLVKARAQLVHQLQASMQR